jgi:hypothetical protein
MVAAGGGNMTHQEEEPSERDQHASSQKPMGMRWRISGVGFYPFSFETFSAFLLTLN